MKYTLFIWSIKGDKFHAQIYMLMFCTSCVSVRKKKREVKLAEPL